MNTITQANQLKGFVESLKLSDNISKAQLEMLFSKLELLIQTLDDDDWDSIPSTTPVPATVAFTPTNRISFDEEPHDLPF
jgi:hypothetical protein